MHLTVKLEIITMLCLCMLNCFHSTTLQYISEFVILKSKLSMSLEGTSTYETEMSIDPTHWSKLPSFCIKLSKLFQELINKLITQEKQELGYSYWSH